jgi:hypothetical protein
MPCQLRRPSGAGGGTSLQGFAALVDGAVPDLAASCAERKEILP